MENLNIDKIRNNDFIRINKNFVVRDICVDKICEDCGWILICIICNLNCFKNLRIIENYNIFSKLRRNRDKFGKCCLCF